ncbi:hypothetical protein Tco_0635688 [Tanacetum coccineum]
MVLMVERNRGQHLIRRFAGRGNEPDPRVIWKIESPKSRFKKSERTKGGKDQITTGMETLKRGGKGKSIFSWDESLESSKKPESEPSIWDIGYEEEEYPFVNKYPSFQEPIVLMEEKSCPVYDTDNEEEESMPVYDTDIDDVIEEEERFVRKGR